MTLVSSWKLLHQKKENPASQQNQGWDRQWSAGYRGLDGGEDRCVSYLAKAVKGTFSLQGQYQNSESPAPVHVSSEKPGHPPLSLRPHTDRVSTSASWVPAPLEAATRSSQKLAFFSTAPSVHASTRPGGSFHICPVADFSISHRVRSWEPLPQTNALPMP